MAAGFDSLFWLAIGRHFPQNAPLTQPSNLHKSKRRARRGFVQWDCIRRADTAWDEVDARPAHRIQPSSICAWPLPHCRSHPLLSGVSPEARELDRITEPIPHRSAEINGAGSHGSISSSRGALCTRTARCCPPLPRIGVQATTSAWGGPPRRSPDDAARGPSFAAQYLGLVGLDVDLHQVHRQVGTMLGQELVHGRDGDLALLQDIHLGGGLECAGALDQAGGGRGLEEICLALEVAQAQRKYVDPVLKPIPMDVLPQQLQGRRERVESEHLRPGRGGRPRS